MTWIQTHTGLAFDILDPKPEQINIRDIAYALSGIFRYTGHSRLTVAEHSVLCAKVAPPELALWCLLHDAHEAYVGDVSRPLKMAMREKTAEGHRSPFDVIDETIQRAVVSKFGLPWPMPKLVNDIDTRMLVTEKAILGKSSKPWDIKADPYILTIPCWNPVIAEAEFLAAFGSVILF